MFQLTTLLTTALVAGLTYAAPTPKSTRDIVTDIYGPLDTWTPIYLKDVYPDAYVDGAPVNSSVILKYAPPANATEAQHSQVSVSLAARSLATDGASSLLARDGSESCFQSGNYVFQYQLFSAENDFCAHAADRNPNNGGDWWENLSMWFDHSSNQWVPFTTSNGATTSVFWWIKVNAGFQFNSGVCFNAMWTIINDCRGSNPDTAGGQLWGYNNGQVDATIDPWD